MRVAIKAIPLGVLGFAVALLTACGGNDKLLPADEASSLRAAVVAAQTACAAGDPVRAERAAQSFSDRVAELSSQDVDHRLLTNLQQGAATLQTLTASTCTGTSTTPSTTTTTPTTPTTPTTDTTTVPTTPTTTLPAETTPTTPPETTPETTPPNGGGTPGNGNGPPGGTPPGQTEDPGGGAAPGAAP